MAETKAGTASVVHTDVLVVGAGPVGLALAGDLGWRGHQCLLIDSGDGSINQPKMDLVGIRTMEFCRRWGLVGDVEASPYNRDYPQDNIYLTSLNGWEMGRQPMPSMRDNPYPPESPQRRERCPQNMFDPVLQKFAKSQSNVELRYGHRFVSSLETADGVTALIENLATGEQITVQAKYLAGCDGGRSAVREQLGIGMQGKGLLTHTTNIVFRCPEFNQLHDKKPGYRYMFVGPKGTWATIVAINGNDQWRMSIIGNAQERPHYSDDEVKAFAHQLMGKPFALEILSHLRWARTELVADSYGRGRTYIAGDACHLTSPTGGLGMNTGIGDAVDLSWKLSACLQGWGGSTLLDSYTVERRPVALRITQFSTGNLAIMKQVPSAEKVLQADAEGDAARQAVGAALMDGLKREWFSQNMHLGNRYATSPVVVFNEPEDLAEIQADFDDAVNYVQSTRPGVRAPHAWLAPGRSTLDLFGRGFVLMVSGAAAEGQPLLALAQARKVPLEVFAIEQAEIQQLYARRFVLVRPDGHVAWRGDALPADLGGLLDTVTGAATVFQNTRSLPDMYARLDTVRMKNGWAKPTPSLYPQPKQPFVPAHWRYRDARAALHEAGHLVGTEWAERRNLIMANPIPGNDYPTVRTLVGAYQMVKAGETARSHRHSPNAMRVVLEATENTFTIVDGVKVPMLPGDVLLTPNMCWHGHSNESNTEAYWVDFLDAPLVQLLGPMFFELHPDTLEKATAVDPASPMRFAYADYLPKLLAAPEVARGVRTLELGPPRLDTFDRHVVRLNAGATWDNDKDTVNRIYTVVEGQGRSVVNGQTFDWAPGDMVAVPSWMAHTHMASSDAVLLQVSDAPLIHMLNWYRTGASLPANPTH